MKVKEKQREWRTKESMTKRDEDTAKRNGSVGRSKCSRETC